MDTVRNSLLDRPIDESQAKSRGYYSAKFLDQDMHPHYTDGFTPISPTEFLIWVTEVQTYARRLGHHEIQVRYHKPTPHDDGTLVAQFCRFPNATEWTHGGIYQTFYHINDQSLTSA